MWPRMTKLYIALFIIGLAAGLFFRLNKAKASTAQGETSKGEQPASTVYEESWKATEALVSAAGGYRYFYPYGSTPDYPLPSRPPHVQTPEAGKMENTDGGWLVQIYPKMVVTKWSVHGHIHFR